MMIQKRFLTRKKLNTIPVAWLFAFVILPLCVFILDSLIRLMYAPDVIANFLYCFNVQSWLITVFNAVFVSLVATLLGSYLAFFAVFQRNKLRYILFFIVGFCFIINPIIHYEFINNFFDKDGLLNSILLHYGVVLQPISINSYWVLFISLVYKFIPISFFICVPAFHNTNTELIECTLDSGASRLYVITHNIVTDIKYHLGLSFGIIALVCFGNISSFIIPFVEGNSNISVALNSLVQVNTHNTTHISFQFYPSVHIYLILLMLLGMIGIYFLNKYFNNHKSHLYLNANKHLSKYKCVFIGKDWFTTFVNLTITIFYVISVVGFVWYSFKDLNISLYVDLLKDSVIYNGIKNQYIISIIAAILATILGTMFAIGNSKSTDLRKHHFFKFTILTLATSEIILIGIAWLNQITIFQQQAFASTTIGLSIMGTLFSSLYMFNAVREVDKNIENASLDLGANYWQTIKIVTLYALYPSMVSCFLLIFICLFNEFGTFSMLLSVEHSILSANLLGFTTTDTPQMHPLATLNIIFTILMLWIAKPYNLYDKRQLAVKSIVLALLIIIGIYCWFNG